MTDLPESLFANPAWHALQSQHRHFAQSAGDACRYPADVAPFAAVAHPSAAALHDLHSLLAPKESVWLVGDTYPRIPELTSNETLECLQMVLPAEVPQPDAAASENATQIIPLTDSNAGEMVALTNIAFPGFFRPRTCAMGTYFGVRSGGELVAMSGERLKLDGYSEISGVCTHPAHRGQGLAAALIWQVVRHQRKEGAVSFLHVTGSNRRAIDLYHRMGFQTARTVQLHRLTRSS